MELNKSKCGILFLAGQQQLSASEVQLAAIQGVPIVADYKYLGVVLNKTLTPNLQLDRMTEKL